MLNMFEIESVKLTSSPNESFNSSTKQNVVGQLLTVQCSSPKRTSKKTGFTQYGTIRIQKKMTILENLQFYGPSVPGNSWMGIPGGPATMWRHSSMTAIAFLHARTLFVSITYVQYAYFILEGDVRSLLAAVFVQHTTAEKTLFKFHWFDRVILDILGRLGGAFNK